MNSPSDKATPLFLRACRGEVTERPPVWLMRQAGRYQAEYRAIRAKVSFLELCKNPELAAEVTVFAVKQLGVDAGIIFADILLILEPLGLPIRFEKGGGPKILEPVRTGADLKRISANFDPSVELDYVMNAIRCFRSELPDTPLIGFAGAPFTLASYAIEGGGSKNYVHTKKMMYSEPEAFHSLMDTLTSATIRYLEGEIEAGAQVLQLFDSWVGALSPADYREFVKPYVQRICAAITPKVPLILFGTNTTTLLSDMADCNPSVLGVDWRLPMADARKQFPNQALQGNLDPVSLFGPADKVCEKAKAIAKSMQGHPGYIFNLGHGILPETPVPTVQALVETIRSLEG